MVYRVLCIDIGSSMGVVEATFANPPQLPAFPPPPLKLRHALVSVKAPAPTDPAGRRTKLLYDALMRFFDPAPDLVLFEQVTWHVSSFAAQVHGELRGVLFLHCEQKQVPYIGFNVKVVKKALAGHGSATKPEMQAAAQRVFQLPVLPGEDEADAYGVLAAWLRNEHSTDAYKARAKMREKSARIRERRRVAAEQAKAAGFKLPVF